MNYNVKETIMDVENVIAGKYYTNQQVDILVDFFARANLLTAEETDMLKTKYDCSLVKNSTTVQSTKNNWLLLNADSEKNDVEIEILNQRINVYKKSNVLKYGEASSSIMVRDLFVDRTEWIKHMKGSNDYSAQVDMAFLKYVKGEHQESINILSKFFKMNDAFSIRALMALYQEQNDLKNVTKCLVVLKKIYELNEIEPSECFNSYLNELLKDADNKAVQEEYEKVKVNFFDAEKSMRIVF
ncbi:MAG: hypothetical protein K5765_05775 [Clostridia bacterium]|nr:hypothetical protein [Clostridia bacterium]